MAGSLSSLLRGDSRVFPVLVGGCLMGRFVTPWCCDVWDLQQGGFVVQGWQCSPCSQGKDGASAVNPPLLCALLRLLHCFNPAWEQNSRKYISMFYFLVFICISCPNKSTGFYRPHLFSLSSVVLNSEAKRGCVVPHHRVNLSEEKNLLLMGSFLCTWLYVKSQSYINTNLGFCFRDVNRKVKI